MKHFLLILLVAAAALSLTEAARIRRDEKYTTKYDNIDLDEILASDGLVDNYFKCIMEQGKCTPDGTELRSHIKDALESECSKCSDTQKAGADKVIKFLYNKKPDKFKQLQEKYDPDNTYTTKYKDKLEEIAGS
uniref:Ejaculatory bulb-specific protein III n=1 Tax=Coptotermes formosanus TaxID=36987 RepID=L0AUI7_COPFO|nr:ejaculatory bulb-specific protein III [Coptotermes formosanus]